MMKNVLCLFVSLLLLFTFDLNAQNSNNYIIAQGFNYPTTIIPKDTPVIFAPDIVSTQYAEFGITFLPDVSEIYFTRRGAQKDQRLGTIMVMKLINGKWTKPEITSFSGKYNDMEPLISPDGKKLIFGSNRPVNESAKDMKFLQWYVERIGNSWSEPKLLGTPFTNRFVMYPTCTLSKDIYFTSNDGIYWSSLENDMYMEPMTLSQKINQLNRAAHPFISKDGSFLIFDAQIRGDLKSDLFISYNDNREWSDPVRLDDLINSSESQAIAFLSPDDKYLFFVRNGDIYWVEFNKNKIERK